MKKRSKQKPLPQTLTEDSDVIKQAVSEDSLLSGDDADKCSGLHRSSLDSITSTAPAGKLGKKRKERNDNEKEPVSTDVLSDRTTAPKTKKRKTSPTRKKQVKEGSMLLDLVGTDFNTSANLLDKSDTRQESSLSFTATAGSKQKRSRKQKLLHQTFKNELLELGSEKMSSFGPKIGQIECAPSLDPARQTKRKRQKNSLGKETVSRQTLSDQTSAPITKKCCKKQAKEEAKLLEDETKLLEMDCNMSTNLLCKSHLGEDTLLCSSATTEPKKMKQPRKVSSATLKIEPRVACETSGVGPAETSGDDALKIQESGQRQETGRSKNLNVKGSKKQQLGARENVTADSTAHFAFNRKKTSTSKKKAKENSEVLAAAETDWNTSLFNKSNIGEESLLCSSPTTGPKKKGQPRTDSSATLKIEPRVAGETSGEGAGRRQDETARSSKVSVKGGNRQNPLTRALKSEQVESGKRKNDGDKEPAPTVSTEVLSDKTTTESERRKTSSVDRPKTRAFTQRRKTRRGSKVGVTKGAEQKPSGQLVKPFRCSVCAAFVLRQRFHRKTTRPTFSCSQCSLEFRFLDSYMDHLL